MTSALRAAKSRPSEESPAWKMTGWPWRLRGRLGVTSMSTRSSWTATGSIVPSPAHAAASVDVATASSAQPSQMARVRGEELLGAAVAVGVVEVAAAAEVGAGPRVVGGDDVPAGAAAGQQVEPGEAAGQVGRLVVRGVGGRHEPDVGGDGGERGELGDRLGAAGDVEVVDEAVDLAQPQPLAEEEGVEQAPLGGLGDLAVGLGRDLRAAVGLGPDRPVVDALEEHAEVQLGVGPGDVVVGAGPHRCPRRPPARRPAAPRRLLPGRQPLDDLDRTRQRLTDRARVLPRGRPDRRAGPVRRLLPRRGPAAARDQRPGARPRHRRPPGGDHPARRARRRDHPHRARVHVEHHVQRPGRPGPPVRWPRPAVRRPRRLERRHDRQRLDGRQLPQAAATSTTPTATAAPSRSSPPPGPSGTRWADDAIATSTDADRVGGRRHDRPGRRARATSSTSTSRRACRAAARATR